MLKHNQHAPRWLPFLIGSLALGFTSYSAAKNIHTFQLWLVVLIVFLFAIPVMLSGMYVSTLRRVHENSLFRRDRWLYKLRSGRLLMIIGWFLWAVTTSFFALIQFNLYSPREWGAFFLTFPLFYCLFIICLNIATNHANPLHTIRISITWVRRILPWAMLLVFGFVLWQSDSNQPLSTLHDAIAAKRAHLYKAGGSALVEESLQLLSAMTGARDYVGSKLGALSKAMSWGITVIGTFIISYNVCVLLSCLLIPVKEYWRVFAPMSDNPEPPPLTPAHVASLAAIVTFLSIFVYLSGFVALETWIRQSPNWVQSRKALEEHIVVKVDEIDGKYYRPNTIRRIEVAREKAFNVSASAINDLDRKIDIAFAAMEGNVDAYLDWYYSLSAEYARIASTLTGRIEDHMTDQLQLYLNKNDPFKAVAIAMTGAFEKHKQAVDEFKVVRDQILRENEIDTRPEFIRVVRRMSRGELSALPTHPVATTIEGRMAGAATVSVITFVVTTKVVAKVVGKGIFKVAVVAVSKIVASKAAGSAAGALAGAAVGSVVPGIGTAIGAGVGFVAGMLGGVAVDASLLKLEEKVSRAEFRRTIVESIAATKQEFKRELFANK